MPSADLGMTLTVGTWLPAGSWQCIGVPHALEVRVVGDDVVPNLDHLTAALFEGLQGATKQDC